MRKAIALVAAALVVGPGGCSVFDPATGRGPSRTPPPSQSANARPQPAATTDASAIPGTAAPDAVNAALTAPDPSGTRNHVGGWVEGGAGVWMQSR